jgi:glycosyltransferase involved in cell wall biosynthesis
MFHSIPNVSVIIPSRNVAHILPRQLAALARQTFEGSFEVVVADNGSTDGTAELLTASERPGNLRVVTAAERQGITHARNVGARNARGSLLLFCDADDVVAPTWIEEMVVALQRADLVGGRLEYAELNPLHVRAWRPPIADRELPVALGFRPFAVGANFGIRRSAWDEVGGCDEQFIECFDDVDLSWRVQLAEGTIDFASSAVIHYQLRTGLRDLARQQFTYGVTEARFYKKFRALGLDRPALWPAAQLWASLAARWFHLLRSTELKGNWIREAAYRAGRVVGGLRMRTMYW